MTKRTQFESGLALGRPMGTVLTKRTQFGSGTGSLSGNRSGGAVFGLVSY